MIPHSARRRKAVSAGKASDFHGALWWNVETAIDEATGKPVPNKDNDRFRALVDGFKGK